MTTDKLLYIEWSNDKPFSVVCGEGHYARTYDVDWCKRDQSLYYHQSGTGSCAAAIGKGLELLPEGINAFEQLIDHFDIMHGETSGCKICKDRLPDDALCEHLWWSDEDGMVVGPGYWE